MATKADVVTLEDYLAQRDVNPGLVASFQAEAQNDLSPRKTVDEWDEAFAAQSARVYKD